MSDKYNNMKNLWEKVFGDSDDYINLVFDAYNRDNFHIFDKYIDDKLVSGMLAVDYSFINNNVKDGDSKSILKSSYLCGLSTLPEYRNKGIMSDLIRRCNRSLYEKGYAISFLIPANDYLRYYYNNFVYKDISYISVDNYVYEHLFYDSLSISETVINFIYNINSIKNDNLLLLSINDYILAHYGSGYNDINFYNDIYNDEIVKSIYIFYKELKYKIPGAVIMHTYDDFVTILIENILCKGKILILTDKDNNYLGIEFCTINKDDRKVTVQLLLSLSVEYDNILLQCLKKFIPEDVAFSVRRYNQNYGEGNTSKLSESDAIYSPYTVGYSSGYPQGEIAEYISISSRASREKPFAMAKILNVYEILKFVVSSYPTSEFSILIKNDEYPENEGLYNVSNGSVDFTTLKEMSEEQIQKAENDVAKNLNSYSLSVDELSAFLWRKNNSATVDSVIKIPNMPLNVALMLE